MENLSERNFKEIGKSSQFSVGVLHRSNTINSRVLKNNKVYQISVSSSSLSTSARLDIFNRASIIHGITGLTVIFVLEENGYWVYGDITALNEVTLWEGQIS